MQSFKVANGQYENLRTYCIAPGEIWYGSKNYDVIYSNDNSALDKINDTQNKAQNKLTNEQLNLMSYYAFYGHGYGNHDSNIYIVATQMLIYRVLEPQVFTNINCANGGCKKIADPTAVANAMKEIQELVDNHFVVPSFDGTSYKLLKGASITLTDSNNVLSNFKVNECTNCTATISNNQLTITATNTGKIKLSLTKNADVYDNDVMFLASAESQNMLIPGNLDPIISTIQADVYSGTFELYKTNNDGTIKLSGANYNIYNSSNDVVCTITTDSNGYGKCTNLNLGNYTIKEVSAPNGYLIDTNIHSFSITENNTSVSISLKNEKIKGYVEIYKKDSENLSFIPQGEGELNGAIYTIYNLNNEKIEELIIEKNNYAKSSKLEYGDYYLLETKAPTGYKLDSQKHYFKISENNQTITLNLKDDVIKGRIKIKKIDSETKKCEPLGQATLIGAKFVVKDKSNSIVDTLIIGDDCTAISKYLPYGQYKIEEITPSTGYYLNTTIASQFISETIDYSITIEEEVIKNYISILKLYDYIDGNTTIVNAEQNITFEIYDQNNNLYDTITTDKNGYATIEIPYGIWKFHQVNTSVGFEKIYDFFVVVDETSEKEHYYNILNNKLSAYLKIIKVDAVTGKNIALPNTTFKILNTDTNQYVSQYVGGKVFDTFKTDENGIANTYLKLEAGNYKLIEIKSPNGYLLNNDGIKFTIGEDTKYYSSTYGAFVVLEFKNNPIRGKIEIYKNGESFNFSNNSVSYDDIKLENVKFEIYADEDITSSDGNHLYYNKGDLIEIITTDKFGYAISNELPLGKYYAIEIYDNNDYILNNQKYFFELSEVDNKTKVVYKTLNIKNELKKGNLEILKIDEKTEEPIIGVKFNIYTIDNELIFSKQTDKNGKIFIENIPLGKYYIQEIYVQENYILNNEKIYFDITENNETISLKVKNEKIKSTLNIHKVDENNIPLSGVKIAIYYNDGTEYGIFTTDKGGNVIVELEYGEYYYKEIETINGYVLNDEVTNVIVKNDGEIIEKTLTNNTMKSTLHIHKVDNNNIPLAGVKIAIYYIDGTEYGIFTTDQNGDIIVELEYGEYYYKEVETINGYKINNEIVNIKINTDGEIIQKTLINEIIEIPKTGINDSLIVNVLSSLFIIGGLGFLIYDKKRKKK